MYLGVNVSISVINDVRMLTKAGHLHSSADTSLDLGLCPLQETHCCVTVFSTRFPSISPSCFIASIFSSLPYDLIEFLAVSDNSIHLVHLELKFLFSL